MLRGDAKSWCSTSMLNEFMLRGEAMLNITF
jgi:hypothetical protein